MMDQMKEYCNQEDVLMLPFFGVVFVYRHLMAQTRILLSEKEKFLLVSIMKPQLRRLCWHRLCWRGAIFGECCEILGFSV